MDPRGFLHEDASRSAAGATDPCDNSSDANCCFTQAGVDMAQNRGSLAVVSQDGSHWGICIDVHYLILDLVRACHLPKMGKPPTSGRPLARLLPRWLKQNVALRWNFIVYVNICGRSDIVFSALYIPSILLNQQNWFFVLTREGVTPIPFLSIALTQNPIR